MYQIATAYHLAPGLSKFRALLQHEPERRFLIMWTLSAFTIFEVLPKGVLAKNTFTEAVVILNRETKRNLDHWLSNQQNVRPPDGFEDLIEHEFLIDENTDEFAEWYEFMLSTRDEKAHIFTLHFEPTLRCQLKCSYCFEKGADKSRPMKSNILNESAVWFEKYIRINQEVDSLRLKFFGGEPLFCRGMIARALEMYQRICHRNKIELLVEMITNGELLDEKTAENLSHYNWRRVQITLDGPADIHDTRRYGKGRRPTYKNIMKNVRMLLSTNYIPAVDIRMTLDWGTKDHLIRFLDELDSIKKHSRIHLSLGLTTPSLSVIPERMTQEQLADTALSVWRHAKKKEFEIPEEFTAGPLCVATAKHSAVLQPNGNLQKCFCTSGRKEFNFTSVAVEPTSYTKDVRFEQWERMDECIKERCAYLPVCGGGCIFEAMVNHGNDQGSTERFCQKILLDRMNRGLLVLTNS